MDDPNDDRAARKARRTEELARRTAVNKERRQKEQEKKRERQLARQKEDERLARKRQKAVELGCPPPGACTRCGEDIWIVESFSPNSVSVTWICRYCNRKEIIRSGLAKDKNATYRESIPKEVQREVWRRDEGRCVQCGSQEKLEFDHIIPVSKGGANTSRNIQLLCETCNRSKSDKIG